MTMLDAALRGGAVALLVLLAIAGLRNARHSAVDRTSVLFDVCAIAYLVESAPALRDVQAWWIVPARLLSTATPAVFELWTDASFNDEFVARWWRWLPFAGMLGLGACGIVSDLPLVKLVAQGAALVLVGVGVFRTLAGWGADLVEGRRRARLVFAGGLGVWIAVTTVLGAAGARSFSAVTGVLGLALAAALLRLRMETRLGGMPVAPAGPAPVGVVEGMDAEERALQRRLRVAMEEERAYREGGLTVGGLAERLGVPEYRLRRLINVRLGHRNFVGFANGYRLDEAMAALADPTQARVTVVTIALDCGFQSIGPFNRAFKARTGETPTEFRRRQLGGAVGDG